MKTVLLFCVLLSSSLVWAKDDPKYPISSIPAALKENVDVVFRKDVFVFTIDSRSHATEHVLKVISILNPNGNDYARETIGYDRLSKITNIRGVIYDADGNQIRKLKTSEIYDQAAFDGFSLYSDNRLKAIDLSNASYPYTIELEYDVEYKYLFSIPGFYVAGEKFSVEESECTIIYPSDVTPKYITKNISEEPVKATLSDGKTSLSWKFKNVGPVKFEPLAGPRSNQIPMIKASPTAFEYDGFAGSMETWDNFGKWITTLNKGRNILPDATQQQIKDLTSKCNTPEEKVKVLYEYLQNKTRYVSIQLGIGGFQPFEAKVVDQVGYGDCKALSNYMVSMLAVVGIKSHYVLVNAGGNFEPLNTGFPSSQFNHAIVCVPNGADTVWLECTSQTNPYGYMGTFTGNRKALAITDLGAKVVNTPKYGEKENIVSRNARVTIGTTGNASAKIKTAYKGQRYEDGDLDRVLGTNYDAQKKWLRENTEIPSFDVKSYTMTNQKSKIPTAVVDLDLELNRFCTVSGKRLFLTPNLMNRSTFSPPKVEKRKYDVVLQHAYTEYDTIRYSIPTEFYPEFMPPPTQIKSSFGEYEASFKLDEGEIVYTRKFIRRSGVHKPEAYTELTDFYRQISKADNVKIVFINKT